jgi:hypothetical protein
VRPLRPTNRAICLALLVAIGLPVAATPAAAWPSLRRAPRTRKVLGVTASDARQAVAASRGTGTIEERMRAALELLRNVYVSRGVATVRAAEIG